MDSISQAALGSAVVLATMGRHTAAWKAALWGAVAGTLPDLDALILETAVALARMRWKAALAGALGDLADSPHG
jgi:inner membrane protein